MRRYLKIIFVLFAMLSLWATACTQDQGLDPVEKKAPVVDNQSPGLGAGGFPNDSSVGGAAQGDRTLIGSWDGKEDLNPSGWRIIDLEIGGTRPGNGAGAGATDQVTYEGQIKTLFQQSCVSCHGPGGSKADVPLTNYNEVSAMADISKTKIDLGTMPPSQPLSDANKDLLNRWIAAGKPPGQGSTGIGGGTGNGGGGAGSSNSLNFNDQIGPMIRDNCASAGCHGGARNPRLETYEQVRQAAQASLARMGNTGRPMPPAGPLASQQVDSFRTWVTNGMPENASTGGGAGGGQQDPNGFVTEYTVSVGRGEPWNTRETPIRVRVGTSLTLINSAAVPHWLHTNGAPFAHPGRAIPAGGRETFNITRPTNGVIRLYDHIDGQGSSADVFVESVAN